MLAGLILLCEPKEGTVHQFEIRGVNLVLPSTYLRLRCTCWCVVYEPGNSWEEMNGIHMNEPGRSSGTK